MRFDEYDRQDNARRIGLVLAVLAAVLNSLSLYALPGNLLLDVFGVSCAVVSMAIAYFVESAYAFFGVFKEFILAWVSVLACAASFLVWLTSFIA
jgi:hypothetical protein